MDTQKISFPFLIRWVVKNFMAALSVSYYSTLGLYSNFCPTTVKMRRQNSKHFHFEGGLSPEFRTLFLLSNIHNITFDF